MAIDVVRATTKRRPRWIYCGQTARHVRFAHQGSTKGVTTNMVIALLMALGVDLIVVVGILALVLGRRRWLKRQPGQFAGAIRVRSGDINGLSAKWQRGSGRWVRDVLVWNKGPFLFRSALIPVDRIAGERNAAVGELKRLGNAPVVFQFECEGAEVEVAAKFEHSDRISSPVRSPGPVSATQPD